MITWSSGTDLIGRGHDCSPHGGGRSLGDGLKFKWAFALGGDLLVDPINQRLKLGGAHIAPTLNSLITDTSQLYESSGAQIRGAISALVLRAIKSGDLRSDLDPIDYLRALVGVSNVASAPNWPQSAKRLVDILISGSRPHAEIAAKGRPSKQQ